MTDDYLGYWNLTRPPFALTPDPEMLYLSSQHSECLMRLKYAIFSQKGGALLVSDNAGNGKTSILARLRNDLSEYYGGRVRVVFIDHPTLTPIEMIGEIAHQLGAELHTQEKLRALNHLRDQLFTLYNENIKVVVIVDEGQMLKDRQDILGELRILLNFCVSDAFLLTFIFSGQKPLDSVLRDMPEFWQRLPVRFFLRNLDYKDTSELVRFRITRAGGDPGIFTDDACEGIYKFSEGCPRVICSVADLCLVVGFAKGVRRIGFVEVSTACRDMETSGDGFHYYAYITAQQSAPPPKSAKPIPEPDPQRQHGPAPPPEHEPHRERDLPPPSEHVPHRERDLPPPLEHVPHVEPDPPPPPPPPEKPSKPTKPRKRGKSVKSRKKAALDIEAQSPPSQPSPPIHTEPPERPVEADPSPEQVQAILPEQLPPPPPEQPPPVAPERVPHVEPDPPPPPPEQLQPVAPEYVPPPPPIPSPPPQYRPAQQQPVPQPSVSPRHQVAHRVACPTCGEHADSDLNFCPDCGTALILKCPQCRTLIEPLTDECPVCGADIAFVHGSQVEETRKQLEPFDVLENSYTAFLDGCEIILDDGERVLAALPRGNLLTSGPTVAVAGDHDATREKCDLILTDRRLLLNAPEGLHALELARLNDCRVLSTGNGFGSKRFLLVDGGGQSLKVFPNLGRRSRTFLEIITVYARDIMLG